MINILNKIRRNKNAKKKNIVKVKYIIKIFIPAIEAIVTT